MIKQKSGGASMNAFGLQIHWRRSIFFEMLFRKSEKPYPRVPCGLQIGGVMIMGDRGTGKTTTIRGPKGLQI